MKTMANKAAKLIKGILRKKDYVVLSGSVIPAKHGRCCGQEFRDNDFYLKSSENEARRLLTHFGCGAKTRVLDVGCGQGRLPIGILRVIGEVDYQGLDVNQACVDWCNRHIAKAHPTFRFARVNVHNERCNKDGFKLGQSFEFDVDAGTIDIVYLYSVFSHTTEEDMRVYLRDFQRLLTKNGKVFFTTFVEKGVPNFSVNPDGYVFDRCKGPLHIVRYNEDYLFSILGEMGYSVENFAHGTEANGQSAIYLAKSAK